MHMSETGFIITVYVLLIWFIVANLVLAGLSLRDWVKSTLRRSKAEQLHYQEAKHL